MPFNRAVLLLRRIAGGLGHSDQVEQVVCLVHLVIKQHRFGSDVQGVFPVDSLCEARKSDSAFVFKVQIMIGERRNRGVVLHRSGILATGSSAWVQAANCLHAGREETTAATVTSGAARGVRARPLVTAAVGVHTYVGLGLVSLAGLKHCVKH